MIITRLRFLSRTSILCFIVSKTSPFHSKKHPFCTLKPPLQSQGKLNKARFGIFLNIRSSMSSSTSVSPVLSEKQVDKILEARNDDHGGVIVEMTNEPMDPGVFASLLKDSLSHWRQQGKRGVWIKMPIELVNLVEPAVKEGFYFHHAETRYLMLVHWLPSIANTLPANATHRVGIGAFVLNEKNDGEDICDAAVREVKEETGIDSTFVEILAFRQSHKSFFEKSDLFFLCMLQPLSFHIQPQEVEIEAAQWMPYEEYAAQPFVEKHELLRYIADICLLKKDKGYSGFSPVPTISGFSENKSFLYINKQDLDFL